MSREIYQSILSVKKNLEKRLGDHRDVIVISWEQIEYWYPVTDWYQGEGEELVVRIAIKANAVAGCFGKMRKPKRRAYAAKADTQTAGKESYAFIQIGDP